MTTTELYSGYGADGKPSSRVLRPPGGGSSNIFGGPDPTPQEQVRREQQQAPQGQQGPANPTVDAQQEYQRNKPQGKGEAPFASFAESGKNSVPSQFDNCDPGSQNGADFRCYSVSEYRNAVVQNAAIRQRAHGQAGGSFNPITHEDTAGGSPYKDYNQTRAHPQQVSQQQQQQQQQQPVRMVRGQNNHNVGKVNYNPITGEEYPADYGRQSEDEAENDEEKKTEEESQEENNEEKSSPSKPKQTTPTPAPAPAPFQKVRQPPGGRSSGPLW
ncbi:Hematological and neurological expressed 1-like [Mactra antiquata]